MRVGQHLGWMGWRMCCHHNNQVYRTAAGWLSSIKTLGRSKPFKLKEFGCISSLLFLRNFTNSYYLLVIIFPQERLLTVHKRLTSGIVICTLSAVCTLRSCMHGRYAFTNFVLEFASHLILHQASHKLWSFPRLLIKMACSLNIEHFKENSLNNRN